MTDDVDDFLAHFGVKGMKWGVRKSRSGSDNGDNAWVKDQKHKLKVVAAVAGAAAVAAGAYYVSRKINMNVSSKQINAAKNVVSSPAAKKGASAVKKIKMDKEVADFLADSSRRMAADQKVWSESLNKSVNRIAQEDQEFISNFIRNWEPKAIGR